MKTVSLSLFAAALVACLSASAIGADHALPRYRVMTLPTLGGTSSEGNSINDAGLVAGFSTTPGDASVHAAAWLYGKRVDLGTLGGTNSNVPWPVKNIFGVISGIAQTVRPDPNGESWSCSAFIPATGNTCLGFVWASGRMRPLLPLYGGNNSFATGTNNLLQTVGWAENGVRDATCSTGSDQVLQFLPVVWNPGHSRPQPLALPFGDSDGAATAINDRGQIVGISGDCDQAVGRFSARHMLLWSNGRMQDLGNIGGDAWNTPMAINRYGDIVGFANIAPGGALLEHAFFRGRDGGPPRDLGTLPPNDVHSQALGINDRGQVVGLSCTAHFASCRGFLYQDGTMTDLNELAPDFAGTIIDAQDINDFGEITGQALDPDTHELVTFLAVPIAGAGDASGFAPTREARKRPAMPAKARKALLRSLGLDRIDPASGTVR